MAFWLLKTDPETYAFTDLLARGTDTWDGVRNPLAVGHMKQMARGDRVLVYHTGAERAVVGTATVAGGPKPDPSDASGRLVVVDLRAGRRLARPVTLDALRGYPVFRACDLLRIPRLSVVPLTEDQHARILDEGGSGRAAR